MFSILDDDKNVVDGEDGGGETEGRASTWTEAERLHRETRERLRIEMQSAWI